MNNSQILIKIYNRVLPVCRWGRSRYKRSIRVLYRGSRELKTDNFTPWSNTLCTLQRRCSWFRQSSCLIPFLFRTLTSPTESLEPTFYFSKLIDCFVPPSVKTKSGIRNDRVNFNGWIVNCWNISSRSVPSKAVCSLMLLSAFYPMTRMTTNDNWMTTNVNEWSRKTINNKWLWMTNFYYFSKTIFLIETNFPVLNS